MADQQLPRFRKQAPLTTRVEPSPVALVVVGLLLLLGMLGVLRADWFAEAEGLLRLLALGGLGVGFVLTLIGCVACGVSIGMEHHLRRRR